MLPLVSLRLTKLSINYSILNLYNCGIAFQTFINLLFLINPISYGGG